CAKREATRAAAAGAARAPGVDDGDVLPYGWKMYSHYARFREIREGRRYRPTQLVADRPAGDVLPVEWAAVLPAASGPAFDYLPPTPRTDPRLQAVADGRPFPEHPGMTITRRS